MTSTSRQAIAVFALMCAGLFTAVNAAPPDDLAKRWPQTDLSRRNIELDELTSGGVPKDGIPAIDRPAFDSTTAAANWLRPDEPVIVVKAGERARAYPIQILIWHEIVNDEFDGKAIAVTFCPLCNAAMVFDRSLRGRVLSFGTTGMLRFSDLVMYDRQTESWWQQFTGDAIVGAYAGAKLTQWPSQIVPFAAFAGAYPEAQVLARPANSNRPYGRNPYRGYDSVDSTPFLFRGAIDPRLRPMERVLGIQIAGETVVYPLSKLRRAGAMNDRIGDRSIVVVATESMRSPLDRARIANSRRIAAAAAFDSDLNGRTLRFVVRDGTLRDEQTDSEWDIFGRAVRGPLQGATLRSIDGGVHFAFAWLAFNPATQIR